MTDHLMTAAERAEYQAETDRLRAANVARVQLDAVNLRAYDKATHDAMQALRDTDHAAALAACDICHQTEAAGHHAGVGHTFVAVADMLTYQADRMRLQVEDDHGTAIVEYRRVIAGRRLDRACEQCGPNADHSNRDHQEVVDMVEQANTHDAQPHSRRPTECRICSRPIVGRFDDGKALSYTHRPKASV